MPQKAPANFISFATWAACCVTADDRRFARSGLAGTGVRRGCADDLAIGHAIGDSRRGKCVAGVGIFPRKNCSKKPKHGAAKRDDFSSAICVEIVNENAEQDGYKLLYCTSRRMRIFSLKISSGNPKKIHSNIASLKRVIALEAFTLRASMTSTCMTTPRMQPPTEHACG